MYLLALAVVAVLVLMYLLREKFMPFDELSPVWPPRSYPGWRPFPYWRDYIGKSIVEAKPLLGTRYPLDKIIYVDPSKTDIMPIVRYGANSDKDMTLVIVGNGEVRDIQTNHEDRSESI